MQSQLQSGVAKLYSTANAFAALKMNRAVVTWGNTGAGGDSSSVAAAISSNVLRMYSNNYAFAALTTTGAVLTWGFAPYG